MEDGQMGGWMGRWTGRQLNKLEESDDNNKGVKPGIKAEAQHISVSPGLAGGQAPRYQRPTVA